MRNTRLYQLFARILDFPTPALLEQTGESLFMMTFFNERGAALLKEFRDYLEENSLSRMEEMYASCVDSEMGAYPYVGFHLFGDGPHRRLFLAGLEEHYQLYCFSSGDRLPDHLSIMLQFLAEKGDEEEMDETVSLCVIPALKKMVEGFREENNPYHKVLQALLLFLQEEKKLEYKGSLFQSSSEIVST
jgi:nitrate reductase assembly molybdenum cofactor insertion protein NarJ